MKWACKFCGTLVNNKCKLKNHWIQKHYRDSGKTRVVTRDKPEVRCSLCDALDSIKSSQKYLSKHLKSGAHTVVELLDEGYNCWVWFKDRPELLKKIHGSLVDRGYITETEIDAKTSAKTKAKTRSKSRAQLKKNKQ